MTLTEEIAEIIGQKRLGGYSDMEAAEAVVELIGWRPIDIAPDTGERILVCGGRHQEPEIRGSDASFWRYEKSIGNEGIPTHWQPLPEPPARKERE